MFYTSADRGRNLGRPFRLEIAGVDRLLMSRTDYIVEGPHSCMIFTSALKSDGKSGRSLAARTDDGGLSWKLVAWLTGEPELGVKNSFSIMPSTVKLRTEPS